MDATDRAFVNSLIPVDAVPAGLVAVVSWVTVDGERNWRCYCDSDEPVTTNLGLLELAKLDIIARSNTGLPVTYPEDA